MNNIFLNLEEKDFKISEKKLNSRDTIKNVLLLAL